MYIGNSEPKKGINIMQCKHSSSYVASWHQSSTLAPHSLYSHCSPHCWGVNMQACPTLLCRHMAGSWGQGDGTSSWSLLWRPPGSREECQVRRWQKPGELVAFVVWRAQGGTRMEGTDSLSNQLLPLPLCIHPKSQNKTHSKRNRNLQ